MRARVLGLHPGRIEALGIAKKDEWGRTVDLHCLRRTFGTLLAQSGVAPRTAQALMRHSDIRLATNIYKHLAPWAT